MLFDSSQYILAHCVHPIANRIGTGNLLIDGLPGPTLTAAASPIG